MGKGGAGKKLHRNFKSILAILLYSTLTSPTQYPPGCSQVLAFPSASPSQRRIWGRRHPRKINLHTAEKRKLVLKDHDKAMQLVPKAVTILVIRGFCKKTGCF